VAKLFENLVFTEFFQRRRPYAAYRNKSARLRTKSALKGNRKRKANGDEFSLRLGW
jgi:hypothetical protein